MSTAGSIKASVVAAEDDGFAPENGKPLRYRGERRADHPRRVLRRDDENTEHADRELRELRACQGHVERMEGRAIVR